MSEGKEVVEGKQTVPLDNLEFKKPFTDRELNVLEGRFRYFSNEFFIKSSKLPEDAIENRLAKQYSILVDAIVDLEMARKDAR